MQQLDWRSWLTLLTFIVTLGFVIRPLIFTLNLCHRRSFQILINCGTAPVLACLFLLATTAMPWSDIVAGFVGDDTFQPYSIVIIFYSLAFTSISLDATGVLEHVALKAVSKQPSPRSLFFSFYTLASVMTIVTSNDIVVLTLTPIVCYTCRKHNVNAVAALMVQCVGANTWSTLLYISNATNIILSQAVDVSFIEYSKWMTLPTIVGSLTALYMSYLVLITYRKPSLGTSDIEQEAVVSDLSLNSFIEITDEVSRASTAVTTNPVAYKKSMAIFASIVMLICVIFLALTPILPISIWQVTLVCATILLIHDCICDWKHRREEGWQSHVNLCMNRMPWLLAPFIICMFILVQALSTTGWIQRVSYLIEQMMHLPTLWSTLCIGLSSIVSVAVTNNQPMTIFLAKALIEPVTVSMIEDRNAKLANVFIVVMASNYGAMLSLNAALAGLMWRKMIRTLGVEISYWQFTKMGSLITLPAFIVSAFVLWIESLLF